MVSFREREKDATVKEITEAGQEDEKRKTTSRKFQRRMKNKKERKQKRKQRKSSSVNFERKSQKSRNGPDLVLKLSAPDFN